jgi:hypothetical protein
MKREKVFVAASGSIADIFKAVNQAGSRPFVVPVDSVCEPFEEPVRALTCSFTDVLDAVDKAKGRLVVVPDGTAYWPSVGTVVVSPPGY